MCFLIKNESNGKEEIVHHDRLTPVKNKMLQPERLNKLSESNDLSEADFDSSDSDGDDLTDDHHNEHDRNEHDNNELDDTNELPNRENPRYPLRERRQRNIDGAIPWDAILL